MSGAPSPVDATAAGLAERVGRALAQGRPGRPVSDLTPMAGGHSGLTFLARIGDDRYVIKAVPPAEKPVGRNDMMRQAAALRALAGTPVPVPRVVAAQAEHPAWFAMEHVAGESIEPVLDEHEADPAGLGRRMLRLAGVLPALHGLNPGALELPPAPAADPGAELRRWSQVLHAVPEELRPGAADLLDKLAADVPTPAAPVLLHGDFRLGNALCQGDRVAAVIDWEIWSVGDPRVELGWFTLFADERNFPGVGRPVPGLPSEADLLRAYYGGDEVPARWDWFRALGRMKMAAIMGHNLRRHREGRIFDPDQERLPPTIAEMIRTGRQLLG